MNPTPVTVTPNRLSPRFRTVALIGPYGAVCGVAEFNRFFSEALRATGIQVVHLANRFSSGYKNHTLYDDVPNIKRVFGTGHAPKEEWVFDTAEVVKSVVESGAKICYLNFQDYLYPDKAGLYRALAQIASKGIALHLMIHDTCLPSDLPYGVFRGIVCPSAQIKSNRFPTAARVIVIPMGVPSFKAQDRDALREDLILGTPKNHILTTFGLGRTNNQEVLEAADAASQSLKRPEDNPLLVQMIFANTDDYAHAVEKWADKDNVILQGGYQEDFRLAAYIQAGDAVVINYPDITHYATSSALRFAVGAGSVILARDNNWMADVRDRNLFLPFTGNNGLKSLVSQLETLFASDNSLAAAKSMATRNGESYARENSWGRVVERHMDMWRRTV